MALKLLLFGCLVAASLVTAERYGVSRGRQEGFGGHGGHGGHGGGFGGHGHGPMHGGGHGPGPMHGGGGHGHGPMHGGGGGGHGHGPMHGGGHGHGGHGGFQPCGDGGCHRPPPHDPHHGHAHDHERPQEPHPQEPKQPEERHPQEPKQPQIPEIEVNFIVHEPEGLEAWIVQQSEVVFFGIEVYVNAEPSNAGAKCDVCTNTTVITNGKLLIEDVDVVVKRGDVLYYYALIGNGHSSVVRQKLQVLHVTESLIGKCNCPGSSDIQDIDIRFGENGPRAARDLEVLHFDPNEEFYTNAPPASDDEVYEPRVLSKEEEKLADELDELKRDHFFLGRIIDFMSQRKACAVHMTNYLLLQKLPYPATRTSELEAFLRSYFAEDVDLQKLGRAIRTVSLAGEGQGIEFEMETYVDKQMVLYWTRHKRLNAPVVDPDFIDKKNTV